MSQKITTEQWEEFNGADLFLKHDLYKKYRAANIPESLKMHRIIEEEVKDEGCAAWWKEVLKEALHSDFSHSGSFYRPDRT